jgi:class 3 adenylate cyclase
MRHISVLNRCKYPHFLLSYADHRFKSSSFQESLMLFRFFMIMIMTLGMPRPGWALDIVAEDGYLALPHTGLPHELMNLKGSWSFYPLRVMPVTDSCPEADREPLDIMSYWNANVLREHPEWNGTSSFCLIIDNPSRQNLSLWWPERNTVDIYGNGRLIFGSGILKDGRTGDVKARQTGIVYLPDDARIVIWIHADNQYMRWRKIRGDVFFGSTDAIAGDKERQLIFDIFIISSILGTAFYQFALFFIHRGRRETFFLGLFCCALVLRYAGVGHSNVFSIFAPELLGGRGFGLGHVGYFIAAACFYHFLGITYPDLVHRWLMKSLWVVNLGFSLLVMVMGAPVYAGTLLVFHAIGGSAMVSAVYFVTRAIRQKREGSIVLALGTLFLSVTAWADMLRSQGLGLSFDIFPIGQLVFATAASLLVSIRFSYAFQVLSHLSHELSKIVPAHVIPMLRAGTELEKCMPIGEHEAVALVFDVVGSTRVVHPGFRRVLETCMARFFEAINQGYSAERLEATGYRIKEMGDGMICSVGFPFQPPSGQSMDSVALQLAERMCAIFHEEMARLESPKPILCGIGLARGLVEGFFPQAGQKQYDLRGAPLTLATRYEAMRNPVYRQFGQQGSVIFIHDDVYQKLSAQEQREFQRWDPSLPGQQIRDDDKATQAWFKFVKGVSHP